MRLNRKKIGRYTETFSALPDGRGGAVHPDNLVAEGGVLQSSADAIQRLSALHRRKAIDHQ